MGGGGVVKLPESADLLQVFRQHGWLQRKSHDISRSLSVPSSRYRRRASRGIIKVVSLLRVLDDGFPFYDRGISKWENFLIRRRAKKSRSLSLSRVLGTHVSSCTEGEKDNQSDELQWFPTFFYSLDKNKV